MTHCACSALHGVNPKFLKYLPIPCLLLIIMLRFTCGDSKSWSNIKMSQNIMTMIVVGLALFSILSTYSVAESEPLPQFVFIKFFF